ncbi:MAG: HAMP domain-containing protein [Elusimicrobiaceae bacterium]|nr:HAMP domain-containing protein [Elusimicrobiaceae bacterium]MBP5616496.1 HAMP domain-containing protein [Elusimicrobiaceae bacterium]
MKRFRGLFFKAVVVLSIISIVPVLVVGYRVVRINSLLLKNQLLQKQEMIASRLSFVIRSSLISKEQLLSEFSDLHTDFGSHALITPSDLDYLRARFPSLFYLVAFSKTGTLLFDTGTAPTDTYSTMQQEMLRACLTGANFISDVYEWDGNPFIWLGQPLHRQVGSSHVTGVLAAAMYLNDLVDTLSQAYPLDMDAMIVTQSGQILSFNGAPQDLNVSVQEQLQAMLAQVRQQLDGATQGEVALSDGRRLLVAVAKVPKMSWEIYVLQPANVPMRLFVDNLIHSSAWDIILVALCMLAFVGVVSYLVIIPITRPLARLRKAVVRLREDENQVIKPQDVEIPNNEIGELAGAFVDMSQTLHERRQELAQMNQVLEQRVEQRTRELQAATGELVKAERLAAIGQMASIISHEIRNPLAVISNSTRLIKTLTTPTDQKVIKQFNIIESEVRQANSIINEVLGYARKRELILSMIDINSFLHEILLAFPVPAGITVQEQLASESVRIKADAEEIKQALRNLLTNAVEAMPNGGTLTLGSKVGRRLVALYVSDTGAGVPEELKQKIFSPFFTTKARGTGLGLAVVRKAVVRHGGKLFITSTPGKGACFQIYLKIYRKPGDTNYGEAS